MKVLVDLFCGVGGFTEGALRAGYDLIIAIDSWEEALATHEMLHKGKSKCLNMTLGGDHGKTYATIMRQVPKNAVVHCHASPPCQNLSQANHGKNIGEGLRLVRWSLEFMTRYFTTWTLEQVNNAKVIKMVERFTSYLRVFDMSEHGIPQKRRRLFASNIDFLEDVPERFVPMSRVMTVPRGTRYVGSSYCYQKRLDEGVRRDYTDYVPTETISYTVTANSPLCFIDKNLKIIRFFNVDEYARLQTFSSASRRVFDRLPITQTKKMIGNSVPPMFACILLKTMEKTILHPT